MPINPSSAWSPRPATGVPTAMSDVPLNRANSIAYAACTTMNNVAPCSRATSSSRAWVCAEMSKRSLAPALEATAGRGRSAGRSSWSGSPARASVQYAICCPAIEFGSVSEPSISCCHTA
ncbi:hypothetical protein RE943_35900 [Prescottella equi]|nr:hypothetical protein RE9427_36540 [Prescottella equi]BCN70117.1 hypothetical protein RE943_35900 [Prescottella equi]